MRADDGNEDETTYFDVLGVEPGASPEEIIAAFREQSVRYHPDTSDRSDATDLFADVNKAKSELLADNTQGTPELTYDWADGEPVDSDGNERGAEGETGATDDDEGAGGSDGDSEDGGEDGDDGDGTDGTDEQSSDDEDAGDDEDVWNVDDDDDPDPDPDPDPDDIHLDDGGGGDGDDGDGDGGDEGDGGDDADGDDDDGGGDEVTSSGGTSRRQLAVMAGLGAVGLFAVNRLGQLGTSSTSSDGVNGDEEHVEVEPSESIQDAVERVSTGGTLELRPGTYSQSVVIDRSLTLAAPDGATFDGANADGGIAIVLDAEDVTVRGVEITRYDAGAVRTATAGGRFAITDVDVSESGDQGIVAAASTIEVEDVTVQDSGDTGIELHSGSEGEVAVRHVAVERSDGTRSDDYGLAISGGQNVVLEDVDAIGNDNDNIRIEGGDVRGQTVEITDCRSIEANGTGIRVFGTNGEDAVTIAGTNVLDNDNRGIHLGESGEIASVDVHESTASTNADTGIHVEGTSDGTVSITDVLVERNDGTRSDDNGIRIVGSETIELDAVEAIGNDADNVRIEGGDARGQTVDISDCRSIEANGVGIRVFGTGGEDAVTIAATDVADSDDRGISLGEETELESVELRGLTSVDNADSGIHVESAPTGSVSVTDVRVERNDGVRSDDNGFRIVGGETIELDGVEAIDNDADNIRIEGGNARGQTVEIVDSVADAGSGSGIYTGSTSGEDRNEIRDVDATGNAGYGLDLGGDSVVIEDTTATNNDEGAYNFRETDADDATIRNSTDS